MKYQELEFRELTLSEEDIYLAMDYRGNTPDEYIRDLIAQVLQEAAALCIPRYQYRLLEVKAPSRSHLQIQNTVFSIGKVIASYLPGITQICMFVVTAGKEYEAYLHRLRTEGDIVKEFVADAIGSVIAEACVTRVTKELDEYRDLKHSLPYSPGYCGWHISEQEKLFSFFPEKPCGITLSESFLMSPVKSVSGFIGLGKDLKPQPYRCEICNNIHCYKRKEKTNEKYERMGA